MTKTDKRGIEVLRDPAINKAMGFTVEEREMPGLVGLVPANNRIFPAAGLATSATNAKRVADDMVKRSSPCGRRPGHARAPEGFGYSSRRSRTFPMPRIQTADRVAKIIVEKGVRVDKPKGYHGVYPPMRL
jgi:hypothetical protein